MVVYLLWRLVLTIEDFTVLNPWICILIHFLEIILDVNLLKLIFIY